MDSLLNLCGRVRFYVSVVLLRGELTPCVVDLLKAMIRVPYFLGYGE